MEIPEKLTQVLEKDGVVAIATLGQDGPHKGATPDHQEPPNLHYGGREGWMRHSARS
jgi:hypothetical protein